VEPKSTLSRALLIPYSIVGILLFGGYINAVRKVILELGDARRKLLQWKAEQLGLLEALTDETQP